ncbi:glycerol uptake facilitator protein-like 6 isoform X1 [Convolutriloba macropyga]|uniref:glycerol uptake facilitator protein-like 6 isoform X1 n=2 Tax=Convolutriloba macropyga TaxID=536237 RepID=UPI003F5278DF
MAEGCSAVTFVTSNFRRLYNSVSWKDFRTWKLWKGFISEWIATAVFLLTTMITAEAPNTLYVAVGLASARMVLMQAFGRVSGAHMNNAVTFGFLLCGRVSVVTCVMYTIAQTVGAITGVYIANAVINDFNKQNALSNFTTLEQKIHKWDFAVCTVASSFGMAYLLETLFTALIVLTFLSVTNTQTGKPSEMASISVGLVLFLSIIELTPLTGGCINPAGATGSAVVAGKFTDLELYWASGYSGSVLGSLCYILFLREPEISEESNDTSGATEQSEVGDVTSYVTSHRSTVTPDSLGSSTNVNQVPPPIAVTIHPASPISIRRSTIQNFGLN